MTMLRADENRYGPMPWLKLMLLSDDEDLDHLVGILEAVANRSASGFVPAERKVARKLVNLLRRNK